MEAELSLVNKVEFKLVLASTDAKFEALLATFLPPLLLKLVSPHHQVRSKIVQVVTDLASRINSSTVKIPVRAILDSKIPSVSENECNWLPKGPDAALLRRWRLFYVSLGIDRIDTNEKYKLIPFFIHGLYCLDDESSSAAFRILCKLINDWNLDDQVLKDLKIEIKLKLDNQNDSKWFSKIISKFFCINPKLLLDSTSGPGLSLEDVNFFKPGVSTIYSSQSFNKTKLDVLNFLISVFNERDRAIPLLIASFDSTSTVANRAADATKKIHYDPENISLIDTITQLYTGSTNIPPLKSTVQTKILQLLSQSKHVVSESPQLIESIISIGFQSDYVKLKTTTIQFIHWVAKASPSHIISQISLEIASKLRNSILETEWPLPSNSFAASNNKQLVRRLQYEALGSILSRDPTNLLKDLEYIQFLFQSLRLESLEIGTSIQEALSSLIPFTHNLSQHALDELLKLIGNLLVNNVNSSEKFMAIKYASRSFPFDNAMARFYCILGTAKIDHSGDNVHVIEEAKKGLHPYWFKILNTDVLTLLKKNNDENDFKIEFPKFEELISIIFKSLIKNDEFSKLIKISINSTIEFLTQTLVMHSIKFKSTVVEMDSDWDIRISKALEFDEIVKQELVHYLLNHSNDSESFYQFLKIILDELINSKSQILATKLLQILSFMPSNVIGQFQSYIKPLLELFDSSIGLKSLQFGIKLLVPLSHLLALLISHPINNDENVNELITSLISVSSSTSDSSSNSKSTVYLLLLSFTFSKLRLHHRLQIIPQDIISGVIDQVYNTLSTTKINDVIEILLDSITELSISGVFLDFESKDYVIKFKPILEKLSTIKNHEEKAISSFGNLSLCVINNNDLLKSFEDLVFKLHTSKQVESMFASGEALSIIASGSLSKVLNRSIDIRDNGNDYNTIASKLGVQQHDSTVRVLLKILDFSKQTKPSLRRFSCIWLLSLVQFCGYLPPVQEHFPAIQKVFMIFLTDKEDLVQESASRGLSIVYENGSNSLQQELVRGLLHTFVADSGVGVTAGKVSEDTELFENAIPVNTGTSSSGNNKENSIGMDSVSTYKDILNLASEVGDPSLVYKFMSLAANSALWASRKGVAFGLGSILSRKNLDEMLLTNDKLSRKLIPKLYRYKYDPNPSVHQSMQQIWDTLIPDGPKTVSANFGIILEELLKSIGNKEWRVREASVAALTDLLQTQQLDTYSNDLERIWQISFRALDDIKGSVRKAASILTRGLSSTLVRSIDTSTGKSETKAKEILGRLLPFLLGLKGLQSDAQDVQGFALKTILEICKKSGKTLLPFIPTLLEELVELMSTFEPQAINYISLNADKYNLTTNDIDATRLKSIKSSPMMDAIEQLIDQLDEPTMRAYVPKLQSSIRKSIGLPSKASASRIIVNLVLRKTHFVTPYADVLLSSCRRQLGDRNDTVAASFAVCSAYLVRIASINSAISYIEQLQSLYFNSSESQNERDRLTSGIALKAISDHAADKLHSISSAILPFAFVASHDPIKSIKSNFETVWNDCTGGSSATKLYMSEIMEITGQNLKSQQFLIRQVCAKSIADMCNAYETTSSATHIINDNELKLFEVLLSACEGRSWSGKESVFDAMVSLACKFTKNLNDPINKDLSLKIRKVSLIELKRKNKEYQQHSIKSFGKYLESFPEEELYDIFLGIVEPYLSYESESESESESDSDDAQRGSRVGINKKRKVSSGTTKKEQKRNKILKYLISSFSLINGNEIYNDIFESILSYIEQSLKSTVILPTWRTQIGSTEHLIHIAGKIKNVKLDEKKIKKLVSTFQTMLEIGSRNNDVENVRLQVVRAGIALNDTVNSKLGETVISMTKEAFRDEKSAVVMTELRKLI